MARKSSKVSSGSSKKTSKPKTPPPASQKNNLNRYFKVVDVESVVKKDEETITSPKKNTLNKFHQLKQVKKAKNSDQSDDDQDDERQDCKYGEKCYQTSEEHLKKFNHPKKNSKERAVKKVSPKKKEKVHEISDSDDESKKTSSKKKRKVEPQISDNEDSETKLDSDNDETTSNDSVKKRKTENLERKANKKYKSDKKDDSSASESKNSNEKSDKMKPSDLEDKIKNIYGVEGMPTDFYHFWKFCTTLSPKNPLNALKEALNLKLVGPFEILNDLESFSMEDEAEKDEILLKHRYYYDPPEFQTCVISTEDSKKDEKLAGYHFGYYRDDPNSKSAFVAFNSPGVKYTPTSCKINPLGDNLFGAVSSEIAHRLQQLPKSDKTNRELLEKLKNRLKRFMNDRELTYSLDRVTLKMKARQKTIVTKCFHGAGICVKVENEVGYRELPETDANLRLLFTKISNMKSNTKKDIMEPVEKMVTLVQFANDECDFGMGLELGMDLFCYGDPAFHPYVNQLLPMAYQLLNREAYARVIRVHLKNRDKMIGSNHWMMETE